MVGRRCELWARVVTGESNSRRRVTAAMVGAVLTLVGISRTASEATAKKKRKKKKRPAQCPAGQSGCPKGFPSACCGAGTECCDTSRLGCCPV